MNNFNINNIAYGMINIKTNIYSNWKMKFEYDSGVSLLSYYAI
jgi:hypothetical protein